MAMRSNDDQPSAFSTLTDLLRAGALPGWAPASLELRRTLGPIRSAGRRWEVSSAIRVEEVSGRQFEIVLIISQTSEVDIRALSTARRMALFRFFERVERALWRARFGGRFRIDDHDDTAFGHFNKYVRSAQALRRELAALAKFRLTEGRPR